MSINYCFLFCLFRRSFEFLDLLLQEWQTHSLERYGPVYFFPRNKLLMNFKTEIFSLNPLIGLYYWVLASLSSIRNHCSTACHVAHSNAREKESCMFQPWLGIASSPYPLPLLLYRMWAIRTMLSQSFTCIVYPVQQRCTGEHLSFLLKGGNLCARHKRGKMGLGWRTFSGND